MNAHRIFTLPQVAIAATVLVVAVAMGSWFARPTEDRGFVAGSAGAIASASPATGASATATPATTPIARPAATGPVATPSASANAATTTPASIEDPGDGVTAAVVDWRASVDTVAPSLGRFVVELKPTSSTEPRPYPQLSAKLEQQNEQGQMKSLIRLELPDASWQQASGEAFHCCVVKLVGSTPIQQVAAYPLAAKSGVGFGIYLDQARPWRVGVMHNPLRVVVDVAGTAASDSIAVYSPRAGETSRTFTISGFARVFEATVSWRIKDAVGTEVARGTTMASIGTSPLWGSFGTTATVPSNVSGNVTLEVFWASPRDGADLGLVRIPLVVR